MAPNGTVSASLSPFGVARSTVNEKPLSDEEVRKYDDYFKASMYLCLGMIYLKENPLLREPLKLSHIKARLLGHWGSDAGQSFTYLHFNRLIKKYDLDSIFISGPGHGAPAVLSNAYLEGTYTETYPDVTEDVEGMRRFFKQFSFPGGIGSHATPETPGSIHEGGELGYAISHAFGAVFDHPDLIALTMVGDGEAETGPLATSWHSTKFLNPITDGAVLPVLHLNGYKINNPTVLARISHDELENLFRGYGWEPYFVEGSDLESMHQAMAGTLEECVLKIRGYQKQARDNNAPFRPRWPMIVLRTPKGWTGPRKLGDHFLEGFWRSHQVPITDVHSKPESLAKLEEWLRSYKPDKLFGRSAGYPFLCAFRNHPTTLVKMAPVKRAGQKKAKVTKKFIINASQPVSDKIFDIAAFEKFLHDRIKVDGRTNNLGDTVQISQQGDGKIEVIAHQEFSGRYLKYLTKKFLKKQQLRDWLRVVSTSKGVYELRFFNVVNDEADEDEE